MLDSHQPGINFSHEVAFLPRLILDSYRVTEGKLTAGEFVQFVAYMMQLYTPLNWFGTYWR